MIFWEEVSLTVRVIFVMTVVVTGVFIMFWLVVGGLVVGLGVIICLGVRWLLWLLWLLQGEFAGWLLRARLFWALKLWWCYCLTAQNVPPYPGPRP